MGVGDGCGYSLYNASLALAVSMTASVTAEAQQPVAPEAARGVPVTAVAMEVTEAPDSLVKALQETLDREVDRLGVPGIQASVRVGRLAWSGASGYKDLDRREPLLSSDILRVGSVTKTFTAGVVLKLSERGYIDLDAPIERWLPDWPHAGEITVRHLLNHTSGLRNYTDDLWFLARTLLFPKRGWQPAELAAVTRDKPLYFSPGTGHHYSNTNYVLLGLICERATGKPMAELYREIIFDRLGLRDTYFVPYEPPPEAAARDEGRDDPVRGCDRPGRP